MYTYISHRVGIEMFTLQQYREIYVYIPVNVLVISMPSDRDIYFLKLPYSNL